MSQLTLFKKAERFEAWKAFHRENPQVFELFVRFAKEARAAGRDHFGARMIWERIRWHVDIEIKSDDAFRLNDHYVVYMSRLAMLLYPNELGGVFELRPSRSDAADQDILDAHTEAQS